ncbi:MAG TPA: hypothetical protein ENH40_02465 [Nitrospirae bacterium]|nr:hypothetical protein [Nitrospirota bacterium]
MLQRNKKEKDKTFENLIASEQFSIPGDNPEVTNADFVEGEKDMESELSEELELSPKEKALATAAIAAKAVEEARLAAEEAGVAPPATKPMEAIPKTTKVRSPEEREVERKRRRKAKKDPTRGWVCVAKKGCFVAMKYWEYGEVALEAQLTSPVPLHFEQPNPELMLEVNKNKRKGQKPTYSFVQRVDPELGM